MRFNIDPKTRSIDNNYSKLGVQGENKVEIVEFVAPKIVGQVNLSGVDVKCLLVGNTPSGSPLIKVLTLTTDEKNVIATWEVGLEETAEVGFLKIALRFSTVFDNVFKTLPTTFEVMETINVESEQPVLFSPRRARSAPALLAVEPEVETANVIENKIIFPARLQNLAMQNDNESRKINFIMARYDNTEDLSKYPIKLHLQVSDGSSEWIPFMPVVVGNDLKLEWTVQRPHTSYPGKLRMQIEVGDITTDTFFKQTEIAEVNILNSLDGDTPIVPVSPPEFLQYLKQIEAVKEEAVAAKNQSVSAKDTAVAKANEAATSASNALASKNAAAGSATTASVKATESANSAAAALTNKNAAAASAAIASTKADDAAASATAAAGNASAAQTAKSAAEASASTAKNEANRAKAEADRAAQITGNLGWFANETALKTAHPIGKDGQFAIVGTTDTIWIWDKDTTNWVDSQTSGTTNYSELNNKPQINGVILKPGNNFSEELNLQPKGNYALSDALDAHSSNRSNPHAVTKAQVGLGNIPNVATNDQTPTFSAATSLSGLVSGEKISIAMGKIAKAIADLISHISNKNNPHAITAAQAGAVPTTRKINGKSLSTDAVLAAADIQTASSGSVEDALLGKTDVAETYRPNLLINGDMSIWQRGNIPAITTNIIYTADMWVTGNASQNFGSIEQSIDAPPGFSSSMKITTLKNTFTYAPYISQIVENAKWGDTATVSAWVKGMAGATLTLTIWGGKAQNIVLNGGWQFVSVTDVFTNSNNYNRIGILWGKTDCPIGDYYITGVKLEQGDQYTGFYPEDPATALARCQRYFLPICRDPIGFGCVASAGTFATVAVPTPVTMRSTPKIIYTDAPFIRTKNTDIVASAVTVYTIDKNTIVLKLSASGLTPRELVTAWSGTGIYLDTSV